MIAAPGPAMGMANAYHRSKPINWVALLANQSVATPSVEKAMAISHFRKSRTRSSIGADEGSGEKDGMSSAFRESLSARMGNTVAK